MIESIMRSKRELGRFLRLIGPLFQLPAIWLLLQRSDWSSKHLEIVYGLFLAGFVSVIAGLMMSVFPDRGKKQDTDNQISNN